MNFRKILNLFNYYNLVNYYKTILLKLLLSKFYNKRKIILRNSHHSVLFLKKIIQKKIDYEDSRKIFFNKNLFAYANDYEKEMIIKWLVEHRKDFVNKYIQLADDVIKKEFSIFEKTHRFEGEINWHYSFFDEFYWSLKDSYKMIIRPKKMEVDVNYVWNINRHYYLTYLGFAYFITKNEKYATEFEKQISNWVKQNPPLMGINWTSGLEIAIRLISWIFALYFFKDSKKIDNNYFFKKILVSMLQHAYYLRYFYSRRKRNHTVGELFGLYLFSHIFESFKPINRWKRKSFINFNKQIWLQTRSDGTNIEQSIHYHKFVLEFFSLFFILNSKKLKKKEREMIENMYDFLASVIKPNNKLPLFGDSDNANILLFTNYEENFYLHLLNLGSILFQRGDLKFFSNQISPISYMLLGHKSKNVFDNIQVKEPNKNLFYFKDAGSFIIRNKWKDKQNYLFIDSGRLGAQNAAHSHSSITNLLFSYQNIEILIDSGTYSYNKSWNERNYFRSSKAHNVLTINQLNQAEIKSWFLWKNKPQVKRVLNISENHIEIECYHNGYRGFTVKRKITTQKDIENITIKDTILAIQDSKRQEKTDIDIYFHFNKDLDLEIENNILNINNILYFKVTSTLGFKMNIETAKFSPRYGVKSNNHTLNIHLEHSFNNDKKVEVKAEIYPI